MSSTTPILETKNLVKTYGKGTNAFTALHGVSIAIQKGETVAILGKSGSGKSTLMHLLALMDKPTAGSVDVGGQDTGKLSARAINKMRNQTFGFVFQQFFLNGTASVLDNVVLPLKIAGINPIKRGRMGRDCLKQVELDDKIRNRAMDLSGGQKQRVVIARAIVNEPEIIFADEPTGNLDSVTGDHIVEMLFNLNREKGITLIIVTHDADLANRCARRIRIKDGLVESDSGNPGAYTAAPAASSATVEGARA